MLETLAEDGIEGGSVTYGKSDQYATHLNQECHVVLRMRKTPSSRRCAITRTSHVSGCVLPLGIREEQSLEEEVGFGGGVGEKRFDASLIGHDISYVPFSGRGSNSRVNPSGGSCNWPCRSSASEPLSKALQSLFYGGGSVQIQIRQRDGRLPFPTVATVGAHVDMDKHRPDHITTSDSHEGTLLTRLTR